MGDYKAYGEIELGDKTLSERVETALSQLSQEPGASVSAACKNPHQAKAVYRLTANEKFTPEAVFSVSRKETVKRIADMGAGVVLIPQDTTCLNYSSLKSTSGLGCIGSDDKASGIMVHSAIALTDDGHPLGLLHQKAWVRPKDEHGKKHKRKQRPISKKESNKWLETLDKANISDELNGVHFIHLCDRESDIFELFAKAGNEGVTYICRRVQNRVVENESDETTTVKGFLENLSVAGKIIIEVPRDSHTNRAARKTTLEVKFGKVKINKPAYLNKYEDLPEYVEVTLIQAQETDAPADVEPISWQLVTNDTVVTFDDAVKCIERYTHRWKIETFHYTLKSGCNIEKKQADTASKLIKLTALYSIIAMQIMFLTFLARTIPNASCEIALTENEWKILYKVANKTKFAPDTPPTIQEAVILIAKLGGFLARKSDGFPGVCVIWRGLAKLYSILDAAQFLG